MPRQISKDIPPPERARSGLSVDLLSLKVGESTLFELDVQHRIHRAAQFYGIKVKTRREGDKLRVWRVRNTK